MRALVTRGQADVSEGVRDVVSGPGRPLETEVAVDMGRRLGHDLSGVRIHTGARASASARALSADAYTVGNAIVFADGHYASGDPDGRALLAHELVHTLQQPNGPPPTWDALTPAAPDSAAESEAARLGSAALRGSLPPSRLPAVALSGGGRHAIMCAPARVHQPGAELVAVQFTLTEEDFGQRDAVGPDELGIRGVMTLYGVDRDEALRRISADRWAFHAMKDHPQPYTRADIGRAIRWTARLKPLGARESEAMAQRRSALSAGERRSVYAEVDREFARRTKSDRKLGRGEADAGGRELWRLILDERLRTGGAAASGRTESEAGVTGAGETGGEASPLETAMASPRMRQYLGSSRAPGAPLSAEDTVAALEVAKGVEALNGADYRRYYANPTRLGTGTWSTALANLQRLQAVRARDKQVGAALAGDAEMIALIEASRQSPFARIIMLQEAMQAAGVEIDPADPAKSMKDYEAALLAARGFNSLADYEEARTGPWRDAVQARALEVAHETLARAIRSARGLNHAMQDDRLAAALFEQLRPLRAGAASAADSQLLRAYPFLANPKAWGYAMKATGPSELQWYLGYYVLSMLRGAEQIDERLRRHPDRVMQWDAVVQEALSEMGIAADSPQAAFIAHGIGHAPDTSFLHQLEEIGDFALYFVPGVGEVKAAGNFLDASSDYDTGRVEASLQLRSEDPSVVPVVASLAAVALPLGGSKVLGKVAKPLTEAFGGAGKWLTKVFGRGAEAIEAEAPQAARSVVPHVETQLADLEQSMAKEKLPEDYTRVLEHLDAQPPGPAVDSFRRALPIAMEALRTPRLYGEVLDEVMARMARNGTTFEQELRAMAQESGLAWKTIEDVPSSRDFWEQYASQPVAINDLGLAKSVHGQWTHIIQDLAVDRALGDAFNRGLDVPATIGEFRKLMGSLEEEVVVKGRLKGEPAYMATPLGDAAWRATFDNFENAGQMPQPELIAPKLKQALANFFGIRLEDVPLK